MKTVNVVSYSALLLSGLASMVIGARIWSAPDVFAYQIGQGSLLADAIGALALSHGAALLAIGVLAIAAAFLSSTARWLALGLLIAIGIAGWFGVWQFSEARDAFYGPALKTLLLADVLSFAAITVVRDADRAAPKPTDAEFHFRWG
ncbi:hypothetical protein [Nevskia sp.]|uniref:hypothetical protein n=1 Tax=Nevskia sp. TaxID=1929292 RepID=UPI0025E11282|nr:hypothetical protein [Nevskia sp.]